MAGLLVANRVLQGLTKDIDLHVAKALSGEGDGEDADVAARSIGAGRNVDVMSLSLGGAPGFLGGLTGTASRGRGGRGHRSRHHRRRRRWERGDDPDDEDVSQRWEPEVSSASVALTSSAGCGADASRGDNGAFCSPRDSRCPDRKPELVAPAVRVPVLSEGGHAFVNGTSAATVYVTGVHMVTVHQFARMVRD